MLVSNPSPLPQLSCVRGLPTNYSISCNAVQVLLSSDLTELFSISRIFQATFASSCAYNFADLSSYPSHISTFSLILKEFNIWQEIRTKIRPIAHAHCTCTIPVKCIGTKTKCLTVICIQYCMYRPGF